LDTPESQRTRRSREVVWTIRKKSSETLLRSLEESWLKSSVKKSVDKTMPERVYKMLFPDAKKRDADW
jgi:hypothetical protein